MILGKSISFDALSLFFLVCQFSPDSTDRVILCRGEQRAILNCLRDIFTQIDKIPPRGPIHPCKQLQIICFTSFYTNKFLDDPSCYSEQQIHGYGKIRSSLFDLATSVIFQAALRTMKLVCTVIDAAAAGEAMEMEVAMEVDFVVTINGK